jgi:hypothetical protein
MDGSIRCDVRELRERAARWRDLAGAALPFDIACQIAALADEAEAEARRLEARHCEADRRNAA